MSSKNRDIEDQITKIMGSYLLRGYRLLDSHCQTCQTPLMKTKTSDVYCIYCNEIHNKSSIQNMKSLNESSNICEIKSETNCENDLNNDSFKLNQIVINEDIRTTIMTVDKKIKWATSILDSCDKLNDCIQLINFIKSCADLRLTLNKLINDNKNQN